MSSMLLNRILARNSFTTGQINHAKFRKYVVLGETRGLFSNVKLQDSVWSWW